MPTTQTTTETTPNHYLRIQKATVEEWRPRVTALAAGLPEAIREDAVGVALIGVLVALAKWQPGRSFETMAWQYVADELRAWGEAGVMWRPATA